MSKVLTAMFLSALLSGPLYAGAYGGGPIIGHGGFWGNHHGGYSCGGDITNRVHNFWDRVKHGKNHKNDGKCHPTPPTPPTEQPPIVEQSKPSTGGGACMNCGTSRKERDAEKSTSTPVAATTTPSSTKATTTPSCPALLKSYIKLGAENNSGDVVVLKNFLNKHMGKRLPLTGVYDMDTYKAVKEFQAKYYASVISPWHTYIPGMGATGYVYQSTKWQINSILCPSKAGPFPTLIP